MPFRGQIPNQLIKAILDKQSLVFVGAGLSMPCNRSNGEGLPSWGGLLTEMLAYSKNNKVPLKDVEGDIKKALSEDKFLLVAQELSERMGNELFRNFLRSVFLDRMLRPSSTHKHLSRIPFRAFLTTNYDTLIEGAHTLNNGGRIPPILTQEDLDKIPNPLKLDDTFIFKVHGDINRPETIVLNSHDYQDALFRRPAYRAFLETLFTTNTGLFIGFGLSDQDVEHMLDRLASIFARNNDSHFALMEKGKLTQLEIKRLALDKRISVIEYENQDGRHLQVDAFLQALGKITNQNSDNYKEYEEKVLLRNNLANKNFTEEKQVFISYSSKDEEKAKSIAVRLEQRGINVWLDNWFIQVGDSLVSKVEEGIKNSKYMIVLLTKDYLSSDWANREFQIAMVQESEKQRSFILPVLIDPQIAGNLPPYLQDRLYLDLASDFDQGIDSLIRRIYTQN